MTQKHHYPVPGVHMSERELEETLPAQRNAFRSPIPTQVVSSGEYNPLPQTAEQRQVEGLIKELAEEQAAKLKLDRRRFLASSAGLATAFLAMNKVFGPIFAVSEAEAKDLDVAAERAKGLSSQFIFDVQTHFLHDGFDKEGMLGGAKWIVDVGANPDMLKGMPLTLALFKFENYVKEMFLDSDTKVALLSGAPSDDPSWWFLSNDNIKQAVDTINKVAGSRRMLGHFVVTPKYPNWTDEVDRAIAALRPASWKAYTLGAPFYPPSNFSWRLDDEKLMYPFYEKSLKAGIDIICIHKGIMPKDYEEAFPGTWQHATPDDVGQAAKDWPQMRFVIYHSAIRPFASNTPEQEMAEFERTGYIRWVTDLARIPEQYGVSNVYGEIGTTFASTCVTNPRFCAAVLGQLVNMMGADHVVWGTDSVFWGSPQWQIEAMRRIEIPDDMLKKNRWQPLGGPDSATKRAIFGLNSARLYRYNIGQAQGPAFGADKLTAIQQEYRRQGIERSNAYYGYIAKAQRRTA